MLFRNALPTVARVFVCTWMSATLGVASLATPSAAVDVPDGYWTELAFSQRQGQSAVFDPSRNRVVVFGGARPADARRAAPLRHEAPAASWRRRW